MSVESFDPNKLIDLTPAAEEYLTSTAMKKPESVIRLATKEAGCSGFAYTLDFIAASSADDTVVEINDELQIAIAADSIDLVRGTILDLEEFGLNKTIKYQNPNATGECGCGESFSVS